MPIASPEPRTVHVPLTVSRFRRDPDVSAGIPCLACEEPLLIHQPDINAPERLLGTCDDCGSWHLVDCDQAVTVLLPDAGTLRDAKIIG